MYLIVCYAQIWSALNIKFEFRNQKKLRYSQNVLKMIYNAKYNFLFSLKNIKPICNRIT